jgi:ribose transport system permease protein
MDSIAAVIVGGTALSGGSGTIIGTMLGALLMGVIRNGLVLLGVNMYWQTVATGAIIIAVCALDSFSQRKGEAHA